jgi:hypothetical protein
MNFRIKARVFVFVKLLQHSLIFVSKVRAYLRGHLSGAHHYGRLPPYPPTLD